MGHMSSMKRFHTVLLCFLSVIAVRQVHGQGVRGNWRTPGGAIVHVANCGGDVCATLLQLEPNAPVRTDTKNPDRAKVGQPLCGLQIGYGFHPVDPDHAEDGRLYDPKSGKTYRGTMSSSGDHLDLRGYIGLKAFGRTEQWTRTDDAVKPCR